MDIRRRNFFRGKRFSPEEVVYLPWLTSASTFYENCTRCDECLLSCPEKIIIKGDGGYPAIDFKRGECTFCRRCTSDCPQQLFNRKDTAQPWAIFAVISQSCLSYQGVSCRSCQDSCSYNAIHFSFSIGKAAQPEIDNSRCTGCGACVSPCPTEAIAILDQPDKGQRQHVAPD